MQPKINYINIKIKDHMKVVIIYHTPSDGSTPSYQVSCLCQKIKNVTPGHGNAPTNGHMKVVMLRHTLSDSSTPSSQI